MVISCQIDVCGILCYSILSYQFFIMVIDLVLPVIAGFLVFFCGYGFILEFRSFFGHILVLGDLVLLILILIVLLILTYSYCYLGFKEERYCVSDHKIRICSFIRH